MCPIFEVWITIKQLQETICKKKNNKKYDEKILNVDYQNAWKSRRERAKVYFTQWKDPSDHPSIYII